MTAEQRKEANIIPPGWRRLLEIKAAKEIRCWTTELKMLRSGLEKAIRSLPEGFFDSFNFVTTGKNLCHPVTLGLLAKVVGEIEEGYVGIDVRLNAGQGVKFQPDIVAYRDTEGLQNDRALMFVDFESPNSCDARVSHYHLRQYLQWVKNPARLAPYVVVTSLPDAPAPTWELRYTSDLNLKHKKNLTEIRHNPFRYWISVWTQDLRRGPALSDVFFLNINRDKVVPFQLSKSGSFEPDLRNR